MQAYFKGLWHLCLLAWGFVEALRAPGVQCSIEQQYSA